MRVERCGLKNVTFILGEMRGGEEGEEWGGEVGTGEGVVVGWLEEALEQLFKS